MHEAEPAASFHTPLRVRLTDTLAMYNMEYADRTAASKFH